MIKEETEKLNSKKNLLRCLLNLLNSLRCNEPSSVQPIVSTLLKNIKRRVAFLKNWDNFLKRVDAFKNYKNGKKRVACTQKIAKSLKLWNASNILKIRRNSNSLYFRMHVYGKKNIYQNFSNILNINHYILLEE